MRPGRFDHLIYIPPPDYEARKQIFRINLKSKDNIIVRDATGRRYLESMQYIS